MRKTLITIICIIIILLIIPAIVGQYVKHNFYKEVNRFNQNSAVKIKIDNYDAGWFTSDGKISLVSSSKKLIKPLAINFTIYHGPITISDDLQQKMHFYIGQGVVKGDADLNQAVIKVYAQIAFNNDLYIQANSDSFSRIFANGNTMHVTGFKSKTWFYPKTQVVITKYSIAKVRYDKQSYQFLATNVVGKNTMAKDISGNKTTAVWLGNRDTAIATLTVIANKLNLLSVVDLNIAAKRKLQKQQVVTNYHVQAKQIKHANVKIAGPLNVTFNLTGISLNKMLQLQNALRNMVPKNIQGVLNLNFVALVTQYVKLLEGLHINLPKFTIVTPQGLIHVHGFLRMPQKIQLPNFLQNNVAIELTNIIMNSHAKIQVIVPKAFLDDLMQKIINQQQLLSSIEQLQQANFIKAVQNNYVSEWVYNNGQTTVNGMSLQQALQLLQANQNKGNNNVRKIP